MLHSHRNRQRTTQALQQPTNSFPSKLSLLSLALASALASMTPAMAADTTISTSVGPQTWTIDNFTVSGTGTISGSTTGVKASGSLGSLSNSGSINSGNHGVFNYGGSIGTISNSNLITGGNIGVFNLLSSIGTVSNSGTISGGVDGFVNYQGTIGGLSNSGYIIGSGYKGVFNNDTFSSLSNSGVISGGTVGVYNDGAIGTLTNSGSINGFTTGVMNSGTIGNLTNSGNITSTTSVAVLNLWGNIGSLTNSGTISGVTAGVYNRGVIGTLNNSGLITSPDNALYLYSGSTLGSFTNSGTIAGPILNETGDALAINGGSGSAFGTLTGFNGAIGNIDSANGVNFLSGNQLLNSNITAGTVNHQSGVLQVNNHITITGDYNQSAAAMLAIGVGSSATTGGVDADTGYGRLIVSGNASIASGASVSLKPITSYAFADGQRFVVVQAGSATYNTSSLHYSATGFTGGITGASIVEGNYTGLVLTLEAGATPPSPPTTFATDGNAIAALTGLGSYNGLNQGLYDIDNAVKALPDTASANRAGAQLNPSATNGAAFNTTNAVNDTLQLAVMQHLDTERKDRSTLTQTSGSKSGVATGESSQDRAVWGRAFGGNADQDQRNGVSGYHANYKGMMVGADVQANADWRTGAVASYAHTNAHNDDANNGSSASNNAYGLTAYAGYSDDSTPWYANFTAGLARQNYTTSRAINFPGFSGIANGKFDGDLYTLSTQAGYPLQVGLATFTPLAGLNYSNLHQDGYTEHGGNGAALSVDSTTSHSLKSDLGAKLDRAFSTRYGTVTPSAQLTWRHEFIDTRLDTSASFAADASGSTAFKTQGATPVRDTARLALGLTLAKSDNLSLLARYTIDGASSYTAQTGDLALRWSF